MFKFNILDYDIKAWNNISYNEYNGYKKVVFANLFNEFNCLEHRSGIDWLKK